MGNYLTPGVRAIARFCAVECALQQSGERSVSWMLDAWHYAQDMESVNGPMVSEEDVLMLGAFVEPMKNEHGLRLVGVRVGWNVKMSPSLVPDALRSLLKGCDSLEPAEWFRQYEEIHPFVDGNGRTGQILFNWLNGTLDSPVWAPNFWEDPRRREGDGA